MEKDSTLIRHSMYFSAYPSSSLPDQLVNAPFIPGITPVVSLVHVLFKFVY
jgi:hypothetical protein